VLLNRLHLEINEFARNFSKLDPASMKLIEELISRRRWKSTAIDIILGISIGNFVGLLGVTIYSEYKAYLREKA